MRPIANLNGFLHWVRARSRGLQGTRMSVRAVLACPQGCGPLALGHVVVGATLDAFCLDALRRSAACQCLMQECRAAAVCPQLVFLVSLVSLQREKRDPLREMAPGDPLPNCRIHGIQGYRWMPSILALWARKETKRAAAAVSSSCVASGLLNPPKERGARRFTLRRPLTIHKQSR